MRDYLILDLSNFPIIVGTYQDFIPTADEFRKWQADMEEFLEKHDNVVTLIDFSKIKILSSEYRVHAAKWASVKDEMFIRKNIKIIFYTPSLITKVMMKAIILMARPKTKYFLYTDFDKAYKRAQQLAGDQRRNKI